ncbi:YdbL family protein [Thalassotalea piscium]
MKKLINSFFKKLSYAFLACTLAFSAWAISLDDAKQKGLVGEMPNGYLGVVVDSPEARSLADSINQKRKSIYINLARKNKITMQQVTALAGAKAIAKTQPGHYIQNSAGAWVKK